MIAGIIGYACAGAALIVAAIGAIIALMLGTVDHHDTVERTIW